MHHYIGQIKTGLLLKRCIACLYLWAVHYYNTEFVYLADESPVVDISPSDTWRPDETPMTIAWNPSALDVERVDVDLLAFQ